MNEDSIVQEVLYPYPIWSVWKALTSAQALEEWLMPNDFVARVGHHFTMRSSPRDGWNGIIECEVVTLEPPHRVAYTWRGGGEHSRIDTLVTFTLSAEQEQTRLRLEHSGFAATGEVGLTVRDLLSHGWKSHVLQHKLSTLLARMDHQLV